MAKKRATETTAKGKKRAKKSTVPDIVIVEAEVSEEQQQDEDLKLKYKSLTLGRLKEFLRRNKQVIGGKKDELVARCVDGEKHGALPLCPVCGQGKLKVLEDNERVSCSGYFDEDCGMRISCEYIDEVDAIERNVWHSPEDEISDAEENEAEVDLTSPTKSKSATEKSENVKQKFLALFKDDPEVSNLRSFAQKIVDFGRKKEIQIDFPQDPSSAKQKVGAVLMQHSELEDIIETLIKNHGFVAKSTTSTSSAVKKKSAARALVAENDDIANMLDEMASLTSKVGVNMFKVRGFKKAAIAVRGVDFVIKSGVEISKGKKKVAGVGKSTGALIDEFLESDVDENGNKTCTALEALRQEVALI